MLQGWPLTAAAGARMSPQTSRGMGASASWQLRTRPYWLWCPHLWTHLSGIFVFRSQRWVPLTFLCFATSMLRRLAGPGCPWLRRAFLGRPCRGQGWVGGDWVHAPRGPRLQWTELPLGSEWGFRASVPGNQVAVGLGVHVSEWHAVLGPQAPRLLCRMTPTPSPRPLWLGENEAELTCW